MDKIVLATGGFDPIHSGHIQYLQAALQLGNRLVVGLNSDAWLQRKKGRSFMPFTERKAIVESLKGITMCLGFDDKDNSAKDAIYQVRGLFPKSTIVLVVGAAVKLPSISQYSCDAPRIGNSAHVENCVPVVIVVMLPLLVVIPAADHALVMVVLR